MKRLLFLFLLISTSLSWSQEEIRVFTWEDAQHANPDSVFALNCSKMKWETIPQELEKFKQLRYLDLSKNKLSELPEFFSAFGHLKTIDLTKNDILNFPVIFCKMPNLQKIHLSRNKMESIPSCIQYITALKLLDIWDNPISSLPDELALLKNLVAVDMRGIMLSFNFQEKWTKLMPDVKWYFDSPCHCID